MAMVSKGDGQKLGHETLRAERKKLFCDAVQRFPNLMHRSILCSFANCIRLPMFCLQFAGLDLAILSLTISCQSEVSCAVPVQRNAYKRQKAMQFMSCRNTSPIRCFTPTGKSATSSGWDCERCVSLTGHL